MRNLLTISLFVFSLLAYSCAPTYDPVYPEPVNIKSIITPGETVIITTKDEKVYEFEVVEITDDAIVGESEKVLFTDIHKLQEMTATSFNKTGDNILLILEVVGGAGAVRPSF